MEKTLNVVRKIALTDKKMKAVRPGTVDTFGLVGYSFPFYYDKTVRESLTGMREEIISPNHAVFLNTSERSSIGSYGTGTYGKVVANFHNASASKTPSKDGWVFMGGLVTDGEPHTELEAMTVKVSGTASIETQCTAELYALDRAVASVDSEKASAKRVRTDDTKGFKTAVVWAKEDRFDTENAHIGIVLRSTPAHSVAHILLRSPVSVAVSQSLRNIQGVKRIRR